MNKKILFLFLSVALLLMGCGNNDKTIIYDDMDVNVQDYTGQAFRLFLTKTLATTTLSDSADMNSTSIDVVSATGCLVFDAVNIYDDNYYFQGIITSVIGNTLTFEPELDANFDLSNSVVECGEWNLAESDGSITNEVFGVTPPMNQVWHITTTEFKITDDKDWDLSGFGGGPMLSGGISGRIHDGYIRNLFLIYDNSGFGLSGFDVTNYVKAPAGVYGYIAELDLRDKYGVVVELSGDTHDTWDAVNRDDLTSQTEIAITVLGHYTSEDNSSIH